MPIALELRLVLATPFVIAALAGCDGAEPEKKYDPDEVIAQAIQFETAFERIDNGPHPSLHVEGMGYGAIYANEAAAEVFRGIDGSDLDDTATFPVGSILVKNNFDAEMNPRGAITILAKFEEGYNPTHHDWFFAMVTLEGEVIEGKSSPSFEVEYCYDCHASMGEKTDFAIGLSPDQKR
jgi:hypothetical protein